LVEAGGGGVGAWGGEDVFGNPGPGEVDGVAAGGVVDWDADGAGGVLEEGVKSGGGWDGDIDGQHEDRGGRMQGE